MNMMQMKSMAELAGGKYHGIQAGYGAMVTNMTTKSTVIVPLDYFFYDDTRAGIRMIEQHLTANTVAFKVAEKK